MGDLVTIDGSSGGGQILRNAVALSAVTGRPVRVQRIRASRPTPGLRPQHLLGLRAVAELCNGRLEGDDIGSMEIAFWPGQLRPCSQLSLDVGTAGSLTLLLQCLLPVLWRAGRPCTLLLTGGTDVPFSPPIDYFAQVFAPALAGLGPRLEINCLARGFYPKGGGRLEVHFQPAALRPLALVGQSSVRLVRGHAFSLNLPEHIVRRMRQAAASALHAAGLRALDLRVEAMQGGTSEGCGIVLWAECEDGRALGASALGELGKRAERVGEEAAHRLLEELRSGAAVDSHLADQLIIWLALAEGGSEFTAPRLTDHLANAIRVAEALTGARFQLTADRVVHVARL